MNAALPFAEQMLAEHGEFFPYAVALDITGEERFVAGDPGDGDRPESAAVLEMLVEGLSTERDALRAIALVSDVRLTESDAVRVEVEHLEGPAATVFLPYKRSRLRRKIDYGPLSAGPGNRHVWGG